MTVQEAVDQRCPVFLSSGKPLVCNDMLYLELQTYLTYLAYPYNFVAESQRVGGDSELQAGLCTDTYYTCWFQVVFALWRGHLVRNLPYTRLMLSHMNSQRWR